MNIRHVTTLVVLAAASLTGCGKQAFQVQETAVASVAPGSYALPAKVDIVFAQDNTGGILEINNEIKAAIPNFLTGLEYSGWDYRFVILPLTRSMPSVINPITQIAASRFDGNWDRVGMWQSPYPGARASDNQVGFSFFRSPMYVPGLSQLSMNVFANNSQNGQEPAFDSIIDTLKTYAPTTQLLRTDAILAVIGVSNGDDTSRVSMCIRNDGLQVPCSMLGKAPSDEKLPDILNELNAIKGTANYLKFFSVSAEKGTTYDQNGNPNPKSLCRGSNAFRGERYRQMVNSTGGVAYDICQPNSIQAALTGISDNLAKVRKSFETAYLTIDASIEPEPASIKVTKILSNGSQRELAVSATDGFTYEGGPRSVYTIDKPIPMNYQYGYVIRLNGSARLVGSESATVSFKAKGAKDSH